MVIPMTHKQPFNLYIASCCREGGIYQYSVTEDNQIQFVAKTACDRPMYLAKEEDNLYVLLREPFKGSDNSGLVSYKMNERGGLHSPSEILTTHGKCACYLSVRDKEVYIANYLSGNLVKMPDKVKVHWGSGADPIRQEAPHTHYVDFTCNHQFLLAADLGTDCIYCYDRDLNEVSKTPMPKGSGARHMIDDEGTVYCVGELSSTVSIFRHEKGKLTFIKSYSTLPDDFKGESTAAAIRKQGGYLYVSNRGHDSICVFKIEGEELKHLGFVHSGGKSPRDFNIFGHLLVCTNESSDNVTFFEITDGFPKILSLEIKMKSPLCVISSEFE